MFQGLTLLVYLLIACSAGFLLGRIPQMRPMPLSSVGLPCAEPLHVTPTKVRAAALQALQAGRGAH